jgi:plastocyanin
MDRQPLTRPAGVALSTSIKSVFGIACFCALVLSAVSSSLQAATYNVGSGQTYPTLNSLPALNPGDLVQVNPGTYNEVVRWTRGGTAASPITIRGIGSSRPVVDANGKTVDGALPNPRAAFQIEASYITIENIEFINARNGNNGSGIRVTSFSGTTTNAVTIRNCKITYCDMGMQSDTNDNLLIESCEVAFNGTSAFSGGSHNFYLNGNKTTLRFCYIHDSLYGQNFKTRGHYTELLYNTIAYSQDGEIGMVDSANTATANSNAVMIGNIIIAKPRDSAWNHARFIQFGQDVGGTHTGTLYCLNNTFIAGDSRINFVDVNISAASAVLKNNIFSNSSTIGDGTLSGTNNWMLSSAAIPPGVTSTVLGSDPGLVNPGARDCHLVSGSQCVNAGASSPSYVDGTGASQSGVPTLQYVVDFSSVARPVNGTLDIGAYELPGTVTAPSITANPASVTVTAGQTATFTVSASGSATLTYQWQKNNANISGATGSSYTTPATTTADSGSTFRCVVSNSAGNATSNSATLTVNAAAVAPSITAQPASVTVTAGQTATFSVSASGTATLSYQWQKNGANISGATGTSYTTPTTTTADSGSTFRCVVSNSAGSATSNSATLTVNAAAVAPSITAQPASVTVTAGQTATFSVSASGTATLSYQWQKNSVNISGATGTSYTTPATTTADSGSTFRCVVSNSVGSATSNSATLTVNAAAVAPSITAQPASVTVTAGQTASFNVSASGTATLSYQWQKNGANISGATGTTYTTPATTTADSGSTFRCVVSNSVGSATSNSATLTVNASSGGDTVWVEDVIPAGGAPASDGGDTWNWVSANPAPFSGGVASQSAVAAGEHQHYFTGATQTLTVNTGDTLIAYVYLDPANIPSEIMLQWNNGSWEHRAYWGANSIGWGSDGTVSRINMGALPPAGQWVRLQIPASKVGLEGTVLTGMAFTLNGGRATWDHAGKGPFVSANQPPVITSVATATPASATTGQSVTFASAASDPNGDALTYGWNFGDGVMGSGATATHAYSAAGTYNAVVTITDGKGGSVASSVSVTVSAVTATSISINSGGSAVGSFRADSFVSGGSTYTTSTGINLTGTATPAPQAVYQSERYGNFTYTVTGLTSGATYTVRLHFAEIWWSGVNQRVFNVAINGTQVLANFDIFAAAGGNFKAISRDFTAAAVNGQIAITYTTVKDNAKSSGIEIISAAGAAVPRSVSARDDSPALTSIDLGTVKLNQSFKLKLESPDSGKAVKLGWAAETSAPLPAGIRVSGGNFGGKPKKAGTFTFNIQIKGKLTSATNTYMLTVEP